MVAQRQLSETEVDRVFQALADATRRDILRRTLTGEYSVSVLAGDYDMSFAAVQKHVAVLEAAGLIIKRAEGRERRVRADPVMIARARALLAQFEEIWRARIDRLDALLAEPPVPGGPVVADRPTVPGGPVEPTTSASPTRERPTSEGD